MTDAVKPKSKKWPLFKIVALSFLGGLLYFAYTYYLQGGAAQIAYWMSQSPDYAYGRVAGAILTPPIIATVVVVAHNLFVK